VDAAQNTVRETTGGLSGNGPWHSVNSQVYHNNPNCQTGDSIEPETSGRAQVTSRCARSASGSTARAVR
jgi:hypothetical protein